MSEQQQPAPAFSNPTLSVGVDEENRRVLVKFGGDLEGHGPVVAGFYYDEEEIARFAMSVISAGQALANLSAPKGPKLSLPPVPKLVT